MSATAKIVSDFTKSDFGKKTVKILIVTIVLAIVFYIVRAIAKNLGGAIGEFFEEQNLQQIVENTPTQDGTDFENNAEENAFRPQARIIADSQEQALDVWYGTNETQLYQGLIPLNGAQLQLVFEEFGTRQGSNLFEWYAGDLSDSSFSIINDLNYGQYGLNYEDIEPYIASHGQVTGGVFLVGEGWAISERQLMLAIWEKSGLPLTF